MSDATLTPATTAKSQLPAGPKIELPAAASLGPDECWFEHSAVQIAGANPGEKIDNLEALLWQVTKAEERAPLAGFQFRDFFTRNPGTGANLFAREVLIPAGFFLVGRIHKVESLNLCTQGDISIMTDFGYQRVRAGEIMVGRPGGKRAGAAHEDTRWVTVFATDEQDYTRVEDLYTAASRDAFAAFMQKLLEGN